MDYTPYLDRIKRLENTNNELASQNSELSDENEFAQHAAQGGCRAEGIRIARGALLQDRQGRSTRRSRPTSNLRKERHEGRQDKTFTLIGSADKDTGTKINQRLSEQRMEYVYNLLKDKYT